MGVPVLCSDAGALPEMGGDAALYFNSDSIEEIEAAMEKIVSDKDLRLSLSQKGIVRAADFNWEVTVNKTFEVLSRVIA